MYDSLTKDNWRDFSQRYRGTYGWYTPESGKPIPVHITQVNEENVQFQGLDGGEYMALADKGVKFKFMPFNRKIYIGKDRNAYTVSRRPARQWRRGVCSDNTIVYQLRDGGARAVGIPVAMKVLMLEEGESLTSGVKLSDHFALIGNSVFLYENLIGTTVNNDIGLLNEYSMFKQELRDAIRDKQLNYKVL